MDTAVVDVNMTADGVGTTEDGWTDVSLVVELSLVTDVSGMDVDANAVVGAACADEEDRSAGELSGETITADVVVGMGGLLL